MNIQKEPTDEPLVSTPVAMVGEPLNDLDRLKMKRATEIAPLTCPEMLPLESIKEYPGLFQPRAEALNERHIEDLVKVLKQRKKLDPVLVMQVGTDETVMIDGHHRLAAYVEAGGFDVIPVEYFGGTVEDAVLAAGNANTKAKLSMGTVERMNYAWRLVCMDEYSKSQIAETASVSTAQVATMRKAEKILGEDGVAECGHWWQARAMAFGDGVPNGFATDDEREEWMDTQANDYADRLLKTFGNKLSTNPEIAARALGVYFGRKAGELAVEMQDYLPKDEGDEESEF